jgi:hypothetical protein
MDLRAIEDEVRFVGLKRSGNHAVLNWIIRQSPGSVVHFNNARPEHPYQRWARSAATPPDQPRQQRAIYSIEDTSLAVVGDRHSYPRRRVYPDLEVGRRRDVLLLRDPFNLVASRFQRGGSWGRMSTYVSGLTIPQLWVTYALEFVGRTSWLSPNCIRIDYSRWCRSQEYRRALAAQLGLLFTDAGFEEVTRFGGGSSFDGTRMDGKATAMRTQERWREFRDEAGFRALFRDPLLLELAEGIHELDDDLREFVRAKLRPRASRAVAWDRQWRIRVAQPAITRLRRSPWSRRLHGLLTRGWRRRRMRVEKSRLAAVSGGLHEHA